MNNQITPITPPDYAAALQADPQLKSPHTRAAYAQQLKYFDAFRAGRPLSVLLVESYLAQLQQHGAGSATVKQAAAAVRWLARFGIKLAYETHPPEEAGQIEAGLLRVANIPDPKIADPEPAGRHLEDNEVTALLEACQDGTPKGVRDAALIAVASGTAIRNEELRNIRLTDVKYTGPDEATITIRHGKGDKPRKVEIYPPLLDRLTAWIDLRGVAGEYLFCRLERNGTPRLGSPLTGAGTRSILAGRFRASPLSERITWHDFRRTAIGNLLDHNVDPSTIMDITGHANFETVKRYDRRPEDRRKAALREIQQAE